MQSAFGFTGNWTDPDTGLLYLRARDYDPTTGQFLTVDPLVDQTRQPYAYVGNNPVTRVDPSGLDYVDPDQWWIVGVGFIVPPARGLIETIIGVHNDMDSGADIVSALVMNFNPVYDILEGVSNAITHTQNGCPTYVIVGDYVQVAGGVLGTASVAAGGVGALRAKPSTGKLPPLSGTGLRSVDEILAGLNQGKQPHVRVVSDDDELASIFSELAHDSKPVTWDNYSGSAFARADGIQVGLRPGSKTGGPAIDVRYPDGDRLTVHI